MRSRWIRRFGIPVLVAAYLGLWAATSKAITKPTDFDVFFLPSAKIALAGHPFDIYQTRYETVYPNANGPLSILPLTLVAAVAERLGFLNDFTRCRMLVEGVFAVVPLLLAREAVLSLDFLKKTPITGLRRLEAYLVFALCPELWHSALGYGHIEQPLMLLLVVAGVRSLMLRRTTWAGVLLGLALLTRSSAILYLIPLALLLVADRNWWGACRFAGVGLLTLALGLFPFVLADRSDVVYSLLTFHRLLPVEGGSIWQLVSGSPLLLEIGNNYDTLTVVAASLVFSVGLLAWFPKLRLGSGDVYALLAVSALCFPLLLKTLWPYYYLDAYMFLAVWWVSRAWKVSGRSARIGWLVEAALPVSAVVAGELSDYAMGLVDNGWTLGWSLGMTLFTSAMIVVTIGLLWYRSRPRRPGRVEAESRLGVESAALRLHT